MAGTGDKNVVNPAHPATALFTVCLGSVDEDDGALEVGEASAKLGMPHEDLQRVIDRRAPVTPELARRLESAGWSTAEFWVGRQASYDAAQPRAKRRAATA